MCCLAFDIVLFEFNLYIALYTHNQKQYFMNAVILYWYMFRDEIHIILKEPNIISIMVDYVIKIPKNVYLYVYIQS